MNIHYFFSPDQSNSQGFSLVFSPRTLKTRTPPWLFLKQFRTSTTWRSQKGGWWWGIDDPPGFSRGSSKTFNLTQVWILDSAHNAEVWCFSSRKLKMNRCQQVLAVRTNKNYDLSPKRLFWILFHVFVRPFCTICSHTIRYCIEPIGCPLEKSKQWLWISGV